MRSVSLAVLNLHVILTRNEHEIGEIRKQWAVHERLLIVHKALFLNFGLIFEISNNLTSKCNIL